jgi:hypothetical protein
LQEKVEVKERENTAVTQELNELRERLKVNLGPWKQPFVLFLIVDI